MPKPIEFDINGSQPLVLEESEGATAPRLPPVSLNIRAAFVAPPGCVVLSVDYSQVCVHVCLGDRGQTYVCVLVHLIVIQKSDTYENSYWPLVLLSAGHLIAHLSGDEVLCSTLRKECHSI